MLQRRGEVYVVMQLLDGQEALAHHVDPEDQFKLVTPTILSWLDTERAERALSFQHPSDCRNMWDMLASHQSGHELDIPESVGPAVDGDFVLPDPSTKTLDQIAETVNTVMEHSVTNMNLARSLVVALLEQVGGWVSDATVLPLCLTRRVVFQNANYLVCLLELFGDMEALGMTDSLHKLFAILRSIVCLNSSDVFQVLLSDELFSAFVGVMECELQAAADCLVVALCLINVACSHR